MIRRVVLGFAFPILWAGPVFAGSSIMVGTIPVVPNQTIGQGVLPTAPPLLHVALSRSLFVQSAEERGADLDRDGLVDFLEDEIANAVRPYAAFDSEEGALNALSKQQFEPLTLYQVRETEPDRLSVQPRQSHRGTEHIQAETDRYKQKPSLHRSFKKGDVDRITIRWVFLFGLDDGYISGGFCDMDDHLGDAEDALFELESRDGGITWRVVRVFLSSWGPGPEWPTRSRLEVREWTHPVIYFSADKHHLHLTTDGDDEDSPYSKWGCNDNVDGQGVQFLVDLKSVRGTGNNVGEPEHHPSNRFVNSLHSFYPTNWFTRFSPSAWGPQNFYAVGPIRDKWLDWPLPQDLDGDSCDAATPMNTYAYSSINRPGDRDDFRIRVPFRGQLTLQTTQSITDTVGVLRDHRCTQLDFDDDSSSGRNFQIVRTLEAGDYFVSVSHASQAYGVGDYTLYSIFLPDADDHANAFMGATVLSPTHFTGGVLDYESDKDYFQVDIPTGGVLTVSATGDVDTVGTLYENASGIIASDDQSGLGSNFKIEQPVGPGRYYIAVTGYNAAAVGAYQLWLTHTTTEDHANDCASATKVSLFSQTPGAIGIPGDVDVFSFEVPIDRQLTVSSSGGLDTHGTLLDANCSFVADDDDSGADKNFRIQRWVSRGRYHVKVKEKAGTETGIYNLNLNPIN